MVIANGRAGFLAAVAVALGCLASCNALTGVNDVDFAEGDGPGAGGSTSSNPAAHGGAGGGEVGGAGSGGGSSGIGEPCTTSSTCASGSCVDGVCCETECDGTCQSCVSLKTGAPDGTCAPVTPGTDPDIECGNGQTCCASACGSCGGEDCTNSVDDDLDGKIDCADAQCSTFACVPAAANRTFALSWLGSGPPPQCPNAYPKVVQGGIGVTAPPVDCSACTCGGLVGTCGGVNISFYGGGGCQGGMQGIESLPPGACKGVQANAGTDSGSISGSQLTNATCPPSGGMITQQPPWSWQAEAVVCESEGAALGGGCDAGEVCVPKPPAPFDPKVCTVAASPSCDGNEELVTIDTDVVDQRMCSGCTCTPPMGATCMGQVTFYFNPACTNVIDTSPTDACVDGNELSNVASAMLMATPPNAPCAPQGGAPTGSVIATSPVHLCCSAVP